MDEIDWSALLLPDTHPLEIVLRGSLVYLGLVAMLRVVLKRQTGAVGVTDLLVIVLIADAAQNGMASDYKSVFDGLLLVGTILFWCYALDWLSFRFPWLERLLRPAPLPLVRDGQMLRRNMRHELITADELRSMLREQGISDISRVKTARIEGDGRLSVIERDDESRRTEAPEGRAF